MLLGEPAAEPLGVSLSAGDRDMDAALAALYDTAEQEEESGDRRYGALGSSAPKVARWLGDIRRYFPTSVVQVMQRDAVERLNLTSMLLEPELLDSVQPDVHLVATLVSLNRVMPETTKRTARMVVGKVVSGDRAADREPDPHRSDRCLEPGQPGPPAPVGRRGLEHDHSAQP